MGRLYTISITDVAVTAAQDLINITATSGMAFKLWRVELGQKTLTTWEAKGITINRFPATVTAGSGGSAATPRPMNAGDAAATITARINDTTSMTTSGTAVTLLGRDWEFLNGFIWVPMPDERPVFGPSTGCNIKLVTAPSASMTVSGFAVVEELF
ncbi:MAG: hypothetical protein IPO08_19825 [Xanthomonadales bacterium]|nr:hypothetical protein [Xanthomonadales bacterium]